MALLPGRLRSLGYLLYRGDQSLPEGNLNRNTLIVNAAGELFCLRSKRFGSRRLVRAYLDGLYGSMGAYALGGRLAFRDITSQVAIIKGCQACSLDVPMVVESDANWMVTKYVSGIPLKDYLSTQEKKDILVRFLNGLFTAHTNGIIMLDRWGGNELVTSQDRVTFLDFDIDVQFDGPNMVRYGATLDLAVALRTCLLWSRSRDYALQHVLTWFQTLTTPSNEVYNIPLLANFLRGACEFYTSQRRPANVASSAFELQHDATNAFAYRLAEAIESGNKIVKMKRAEAKEQGLGRKASPGPCVNC